MTASLSRRDVRHLAVTPVAVALALVAVGVTAMSASVAPRAPSMTRGCALLRGTPPPFGTAPCPGVRPGASAVGGCTLNFLFDGDDGYRYVGTAGHCLMRSSNVVETSPEMGEKSWRPGTGPPATDGNGRRIGEYAYAIHKNGRPSRDFGLIRVDPSVKAKAQMCYFGGPTEVESDRVPVGALLHHFGNGWGIGTVPVVNQPVLPARLAVAVYEDPDIVGAYGAASGGDSGSPVITTDGGALGVLVAINAGGGLTVTRVAPQVRRAERVLDVALILRTAPLQ